MRTTRASLIAGCATLLLVASNAAAHDHVPPRTKLVSGDHSQAGKLWSHCWTEPGANEGETTRICRDYIWLWPRKERVEAGARASIIFKSSVEPNDIDIGFWRRIDENKAPVGNQHFLDVRVVPVRDGTEIVAYRARFTLPSRPSHLYLQAFGTWPDQDGSDDQQDAFYHFHLRSRR